MRFFAIPRRPDGSDRLGTEGVVAGEYASLATFRRYALERHRRPGVTYSLYLLTDSRSWLPRGTG